MSIRFGSVCSGIEAATVAWSPLGWTPQWYAEVDPFCRDLLAHHYPSTYCYMDLNDITEAILSGDPDNAPEPIDLLVGGTPCQAFSVAGGRAGLDDPRGDVTLQWLRLVRAIKPRWLVWENVPGVLSIDGGRTFGTILGTLGELGYGVAYRILDAQYFGVPQRRRRVFLVGHIGGEWRRAAAVLFESPGVPGNPAPRRGKGTAVAALTSTGVGTCGADDNQGQAGHLIAHACLAKGGSGYMDPNAEMFIPVWLNGRQDPITAPQCGPLDTNPNTNVVAIPILEAGARTGKSTTDPRAGIGIGSPGDPMFTLQSGKQHAVAFNLRGRSHGAQPEPAPNNCASLRASQGGSSNSYIAFDPTQVTSPTNRSNPQPGDPCHTMPAHGRPPAIAFTERGRDGGRNLEYQENVYYALTNPGSGGRAQSRQLFDGAAVRRITPTEAERLQGFPDSYTAIPTSNGKPTADGPRYRALGNSMAVPVMAWIGRRIDLMEKLIRRGLV